ncbi:MAG TPA: Rieske 2Fe-2S domain-containing protein [Clostridia bacterium]|nr:Rieske 2Fe-2S domain-containing protein [Clostridia bacterium]
MVQKTNLSKELSTGILAPSVDTDNIKIGEAKVFDVDGKRRGAFRDKDGRVHLVDLVCTHMGCEPQWNTAEQSWDCPCHGSRFTYDGQVLEGPAKKPLANAEIIDS